MQPAALCFSTPISVKVTSSGDEGWECEEGDCVWYPREGLPGLPGLGLPLPEEPAYRMTPPIPADKGEKGGAHQLTLELRGWGQVIHKFLITGQNFIQILISSGIIL